MTAVSLVAGCSSSDSSSDADERFDKAISERNLQVDPDQARLQAKNSCADLTASTCDPANLDPFELARIVQKVEIKTNLSQDDAAHLIALGIESYCPEFKA